MSIFDPQGPWMFGNDGTRDEKEQEKEHQEEACRLMEQYQAYIGVIEEQQGVIRGSKLACDFGTDKVLLDMYEDHGVIKADSNAPIATCADCLPDNIHHFGSCLCPEKLYAGRLPMTKGSWGDGTSPKKATNNIYAHVCVPLIKKDQGWQQIGKDILIEVGYKKYEFLLLDNAVLVCQYGGIIRILEVPDAKEEEDWEQILSHIMQLDGNSVEEKKLLEYIESMNDDIRKRMKKDPKYEKLLWDQDKIDIVWEKCTKFYEEYQVLVDPRMLIAIVCAEGSGSFHTSRQNKAKDGGNGIHDNFEEDCQNAVNLLGGKIMAYPYYCDKFVDEVMKSNSKEGMKKIKEEYDVDILYYLNWKTPRLYFDEVKFDSGVYAEDNNWHKNVRYIYSYLVDNNRSKEAKTYTEYILELDENIFFKAAEKHGIEVNPDVVFQAVPNGADSKGKANGEYTVIGIINGKQKEN